MTDKPKIHLRDLKPFGEGVSFVKKYLDRISIKKHDDVDGQLYAKDRTYMIVPRQDIPTEWGESYNNGDSNIDFDKERMIDILSLFDGPVKIMTPTDQSPLIIFNDDIMVLLAPRVYEDRGEF